MQLLPNDIYGFWDDRLFKHIRSHTDTDNRKEANKKEESRNKMPTHMNVIIIMVRTGWMNV